MLSVDKWSFDPLRLAARSVAATKLAASFYGPEYGATITGLDREIAWAQFSNTEVFLYIPYGFTVGK